MTKFTEQQAIVALNENFGIQARAAEALGVSRAALALRIASNKRLQEALVEAKEAVLDQAEKVVIDKFDDGDGKNARWWLEQQGRKRGFGPGVQTGPSLNVAFVIQNGPQPLTIEGAPALPAADEE